MLSGVEVVRRQTERNAAGKAISADAVADAPRDSAEAASSLSRRRKPLRRRRVDAR
jgi:hypothetical protein